MLALISDQCNANNQMSEFMNSKETNYETLSEATKQLFFKDSVWDY